MTRRRSPPLQLWKDSLSGQIKRVIHNFCKRGSPLDKGWLWPACQNRKGAWQWLHCASDYPPEKAWILYKNPRCPCHPATSLFYRSYTTTDGTELYGAVHEKKWKQQQKYVILGKYSPCLISHENRKQVNLITQTSYIHCSLSTVKCQMALVWMCLYSRIWDFFIPTSKTDGKLSIIKNISQQGNCYFSYYVMSIALSLTG